MSGLASIFEPEEVIGALWHRLVAQTDSEKRYPEAGVPLADMQQRLTIFFRGLGGPHGVEIKPIDAQNATYRKSWLARIGHANAALTTARFDGDILYLPQCIDLLPDRERNEGLYKWLTVWAVTAAATAMTATAAAATAMATTTGTAANVMTSSAEDAAEPAARGAAAIAQTTALQPPLGALRKMERDPLHADLLYLRNVRQITAKIFQHYPGMIAIHARLLPSLAADRVRRKLPRQEQAVESLIMSMLGQPQLTVTPQGAADPLLQALLQAFWRVIETSDADLPEALRAVQAAAGYQPFMPCPLWGEIVDRDLAQGARRDPPGNAPANAPADEGQDQDRTVRKARRNQSDQIERRDPLVINRFEAILSWSDMMNISRAVEDDDEDAARRAADDQEELGLANLSRKAATTLKFDLDLAPADVVHERLASKFVYPEWDYRQAGYHEDHCRVLAGPAPVLEEGATWQPDKAARQRIRAVKRQFEALRSRREKQYRQIDGDEIDMDALIRARCDVLASGEGSARVFTNMREAQRDLSVAVLIDTSRSSESWIDGRQVIEVSREALLALSIGLSACGDDNAIYSFSSLRRDRVSVLTIKDFSQNLGPQVFSRIGAMRPGFYTRLGAATRHVTAQLQQTGSARRLLLILTDGKPNDLDHYEGRYGIEDSAKAVREARRAGIAVFGMTIDSQAQSYFPYIFGRNAYSIVAHASHLTRALPLMYRHLVR